MAMILHRDENWNTFFGSCVRTLHKCNCEVKWYGAKMNLVDANNECVEILQSLVPKRRFQYDFSAIK